MREGWTLSHHERSAGRRAQRLGVELLQFYARRHQPLQHWRDTVLLPTLVRREISDVIIAQAAGLAGWRREMGAAAGITVSRELSAIVIGVSQ